MPETETNGDDPEDDAGLEAMGLEPGWPSVVVVLAGPTATGKSAVALRLAERLGAEIVSVDSMQVYRGMDLGTAKPSPGERARVPHHLIDVVEPDEPFDAARFARLARAAITDILARGRVPILCGGTGLYFNALFAGLGAAPASDPALRSELEGVPLPELLRELAERDPVAYAQIDRRNPRRVIRAIEVIRLTGKPFSQQRAVWKGRGTSVDYRGAASAHPSTLDPPPSTLDTLAHFGLERCREDLHRRIEARVEEMFSRGLVAETRQLLARGPGVSRTAMQALGYRQVAEHLAGERPLAETIDLVKLRTRQFAKRQMTWFRRQLALRWIPLESGQSAEAVAKRLAEECARFAK